MLLFTLMQFVHLPPFIILDCYQKSQITVRVYWTKILYFRSSCICPIQKFNLFLVNTKTRGLFKADILEGKPLPYVITLFCSLWSSFKCWFSFCSFPTALPKVMINVRTSVQTVMIGNSVEFECQAVGDPEPTVKWSKVGSLLPKHIMVKGGMLRIERITEADAGQYRCTATNNVGSVQSQVLLKVQCECKNLFFFLVTHKDFNFFDWNLLTVYSVTLIF